MNSDYTHRPIPITKMDVKPEEQKLLQYIRSLEWGKLTVEVKNKVPVMVHEPLKDVKLTEY